MSTTIYPKLFFHVFQYSVTGKGLIQSCNGFETTERMNKNIHCGDGLVKTVAIVRVTLLKPKYFAK